MLTLREAVPTTHHLSNAEFARPRRLTLASMRLWLRASRTKRDNLTWCASADAHLHWKRSSRSPCFPQIAALSSHT